MACKILIHSRQSFIPASLSLVLSSFWNFNKFGRCSCGSISSDFNKWSPWPLGRIHSTGNLQTYSAADMKHCSDHVLFGKIALIFHWRDWSHSRRIRTLAVPKIPRHAFMLSSRTKTRQCSVTRTVTWRAFIAFRPFWKYLDASVANVNEQKSGWHQPTRSVNPTKQLVTYCTSKL